MWSLAAVTTTDGSPCFSRQQVCGFGIVNFPAIFGLPLPQATFGPMVRNFSTATVGIVEACRCIQTRRDGGGGHYPECGSEISITLFDRWAASVEVAPPGFAGAQSPDTSPPAAACRKCGCTIGPQGNARTQAPPRKSRSKRSGLRCGIDDGQNSMRAPS